jgi:hypothetical protein
MRLDRKIEIRRGNKVASRRHPPDLHGESLLLFPVAHVLDHRIRKHPIKGMVRERKRTAIGNHNAQPVLFIPLVRGRVQVCDGYAVESSIQRRKFPVHSAAATHVQQSAGMPGGQQAEKLLGLAASKTVMDGKNGVADYRFDPRHESH